MPILTVRNLSEEVHRALRVRAAQHGRSTETAVRATLEGAVKPERHVKLTDAELALFEQRDKTAARP